MDFNNVRPLTKIIEMPIKLISTWIKITFEIKGYLDIRKG